MRWRLTRLTGVIAVSYVAAGFFLWQGLLIVTHPSSHLPTWIGWLAIGVGVFKGVLWTFVAVQLLRHRKTVADALR
jgi:uncharacterized protein involved in cysteine biosynthesis